MEYYDVIIVGAGIAGTGLAYNLKKVGYHGKVLVLDKNKVGGNEVYGYRSTFASVIKKYNLPYKIKFKGLKFGIETKVCATFKEDIRFVDYRKTCNNLFKRSNALFKKEEAKNINKNILITNKTKYKFRYLIDCSGINFFLRRKLNKKKPFRFWTGSAKIFENNGSIDKDFAYYLYGKDRSFEEIYLVGDKILQCIWVYNKKIDFSKIKHGKNTYLNTKLKNAKLLKHQFIAYPCSPVFPLSYKNYAFLGDSFGNAPPGGAFGIHTILDTSEILADTLKNNNLKSYEKFWKKKYFKQYINLLISKMDRYHNSRILKKIKNYPSYEECIKIFTKYPGNYLNLLKNKQGFSPPKELMKLFPKRRILFYIYYYLKLRLKYLMM